MVEFSVIVEEVASVFRSNPYLWIFVISLISNSIPYLSVPYLIFLVTLSTQFNHPLELLGLAVFSALGATFGKTVVYAIGRGASRLASESTRANIRRFSDLAKRWGWFLIFIAAATPIPDDIVYIPFAFSGFSLWIYILSIAFGKIILKSLIVFLGSSVAWIIQSAGLDFIVVPAMIILSVIVMIIIARVSWINVIEAYNSRGITAALRSFIEEIFKSFIDMFKAIITISRSKSHKTP